MPNPVRQIAKGRPVYSIPVIMFMDDVSGAKTTQWNKHYSAYMSNGSIPREKLQSEFHVRFVATSPHASPLELMEGIRKSFESAFESPVTAFDVENNEEVLIRPWPLFWPGDNPMQAEECSCAPLNANYNCRTCHYGGTTEHCQSDQGFLEVFRVTEDVSNTGVKDALAQITIDGLAKLGQELRGPTVPSEKQLTREKITFTGVNMHLDTPTEILHTILLGVVKYFWGQTTFIINKNKDSPKFLSRLNPLNADGLKIPAIQGDYMWRYRGGLIGKHFKTVSQILAFTVYDLMPKDVLDAWLLIGRLTVLLWHTSIKKLDEYLVELEAVIGEFLDVTARCSPAILISKPKFHFLVHLPMYIKRFGPAILFSTKRFESFNAVFRAASIFSNRLSPSRDIALKFAELDRLKRIATGGY
ncbi:hypothetical protein BDV93DRAFT_460863 [Ceratobasidium sp. AG-I]|nr:hypothetical protein BDV93DRAFT_460863 [Ceratobasidium sp. AG-I]